MSAVENFKPRLQQGRGKLKRMKMKITDIKTAEPFEALFPVSAEVLFAIRDSMKAKGYDVSQPIILWNGIVIDGHTRLAAAFEANIHNVPVIEMDFADEDEALKYAIDRQRVRRNISHADILRCVEALIGMRKPVGAPVGNDNNKKSIASNEAIDLKPKKTAAKIAEIVGVSRPMVERSIAVIDHADDETKQAVKSGEMTISRAAKKTLEERRAKKELKTQAPKEKPESIAVPPRKMSEINGALHFARMAIAELQSMQDSDPFINEAWELVKNYIQKREIKPGVKN